MKKLKQRKKERRKARDSGSSEDEMMDMIRQTAITIDQVKNMV